MFYLYYIIYSCFAFKLKQKKTEIVKEGYEIIYQYQLSLKIKGMSLCIVNSIHTYRLPIKQCLVQIYTIGRETYRMINKRDQSDYETDKSKTKWNLRYQTTATKRQHRRYKPQHRTIFINIHQNPNYKKFLSVMTNSWKWGRVSLLQFKHIHRHFQTNIQLISANMGWLL